MSERTINLTVIGDRACSTTRAYLHYLRKSGLRPRRLWLVDFRARPKWLATAGRLFGAERVNWLRAFEGRAPVVRGAEFVELCEALQRAAGFDVIDLVSDLDGNAYADEVRNLTAVDYDDPSLQAKIFAHTDTAFLYTNGGIVPPRVLDHTNVRVFHIHPGIVPDVRGSDCLMWSSLDRRRIGVSCFYMSAGIDEGDLLGQMEFQLPELSPLRPFLTAEREDTAYRALLFAIDPHYRAKLLVNVVTACAGQDLRFCPAVRQRKAKRPAYLWMHPSLRLYALKSMIA